jgi:hypothetical protein
MLGEAGYEHPNKMFNSVTKSGGYGKHIFHLQQDGKYKYVPN